MPNLLKVAMIETILSLRQRGWSRRRIARELGVHRETVARYLRRAAAAEPRSKPAIAPLGTALVEAGSKPAIAPLGTALVEAGSKPAKAPLGAAPADASSKPAKAPLGAAGLPEDTKSEPSADAPPSARAGRASDCASWQAVIQAKLDLGLSAQRIYQDLATEHGFAGSYYSVRRFVRRLEARQELPFRRLECAPGEEAQVDFGSGAPVVGPDGKRRRTHGVQFRNGEELVFQSPERERRVGRTRRSRSGL